MLREIAIENIAGSAYSTGATGLFFQWKLRAELAALGVARISYGHGPWAAAMNWLSQQAEAVLAGEVVPYAAG